MNIKKILAALAVMVAITGGLTGAVAATDHMEAEITSYEDGDVVVIEDGEERTALAEVEEDNEYSLMIMDSDGETIKTYTADTTAIEDSEDFEVESSYLADDLTAVKSEGDTYTVHIHDETNNEHIVEVDVTIGHVADSVQSVDEETVMNEDMVEINTDEPLIGIFGDSTDVVEVEKEFSGLDTGEEQKLVLQMEDEEVSDIYAESIDGVDAGDEAEQQLTANGEQLTVNLDEPADTNETSAYYDSDVDAVVLDTEPEQSSVLVESVGNDGYSFADTFSFGFNFDVFSVDIPDFSFGDDAEDDEEEKEE